MNTLGLADLTRVHSILTDIHEHRAGLLPLPLLRNNPRITWVPAMHYSVLNNFPPAIFTLRLVARYVEHLHKNKLPMPRWGSFEDIVRNTIARTFVHTTATTPDAATVARAATWQHGLSFIFDRLTEAERRAELLMGNFVSLLINRVRVAYLRIPPSPRLPCACFRSMVQDNASPGSTVDRPRSRTKKQP
jgi:hypothetical protein